MEDVWWKGGRGGRGGEMYFEEVGVTRLVEVDVGV